MKIKNNASVFCGQVFEEYTPIIERSIVLIDKYYSI